ncbi:alpha-L-iduronidase [Anopheles bellator]|uniref:alpha-L-iduronidase n=1 Tax=Anopheles bellator TaxID=139047 RepID=UPI0026488994|nr:alpha-L-iduronidase [Anopheles bellator]
MAIKIRNIEHLKTMTLLELAAFAWLFVAILASVRGGAVVQIAPLPLMISLHQSTNGERLHAQRMEPFWASTGLCPPEPRNNTATFLLSRDSLLNLQLIGSLTDRAISHVRIHWLLELIRVSTRGKNWPFTYDFMALDKLLDHLHDIGLYPGFELMGLPQGDLGLHPYDSVFWTDLVQQLVLRYTTRYGLQYVIRWRFESWNEPDLRSYNMLNFTVSDYLMYIQSIRAGLDEARLMLATSAPFSLNGPAGLFKEQKHHLLCWAALELCATRKCPFDTITFHRKASGRWASEVLSSSRQLLDDLFARYPTVRGMAFANDEADPVASWSTPRPFQADVRYAAMLVSIVLQHWSAMARNTTTFGNFRFLSHDNAFLSYHPYEFEQRTLLARFQMNETQPPHVQFIVKPVFSALGMLAQLGSYATRTHFGNANVSYIVSFEKDQSYLSILASRSNDSSPVTWRRNSQLTVVIPLTMLNNSTSRKSYIVEALQDGRTDPFKLWIAQGRPPYPSADQLAALRSVQLPAVLNGGPQIIAQNVTDVRLSLFLRAPWILAVRICSDLRPPPGVVRRVRVQQVFKKEVIIFWKPPKKGDLRCIVTYEVWYKPAVRQARHKRSKIISYGWKPINARQHTPFAFLQHRAQHSTGGYYKVRAIDMFNRTGQFSAAFFHAANTDVS